MAILSLSISCDYNLEIRSNQQVLYELDHLVKSQSYFKLQQSFESRQQKLSLMHAHYYNAIINKVFNKPEASNKEIDELLNSSTVGLIDTLLNNLYRAKLENHINLFEYEMAAQTSEYIQKNFLAITDSTDMEMLRNEIKIWRALCHIPKQQMIKNEDATIPMYKDKVGLFNVDVKLGDSTKNFIFDTGANFSVIIRSLAENLKLQIIDADFYVTAATGMKVNSSIAIADELQLGSITFRNVFFLVLDDKDLSFPQIGYYPNGAIGFPVIEALEEIRINKDNQIFVPQEPAVYSHNNFALDGLMPVIAGLYKGDTLRFNFDTGATKTSLYPLFYKDYQQEIEASNEKTSFSSTSGGGSMDFDGYVIDDFPLKIADSEVTLNGLHLHIDNIGGRKQYVHGNFGQDYIRKFDEMIFSFKFASVLFK